MNIIKTQNKFVIYITSPSISYATQEITSRTILKIKGIQFRTYPKGKLKFFIPLDKISAIVEYPYIEKENQ